MANNKKKAKPAPGGGLDKVADYRFPEATRKNNPPAKIAAEGHVPLVPKAEYFYSPRRPPELRFDPTGREDELPELLATARQRALTETEAWALAEALRVHEPWLEWAGKREARSFAVDPVALHIHERVSAQAILKVAAREDVNRSLFADPEQEYNEAVQFYRHDVDWSNRLILGDSLQVMSSLARREDLAGKVQMIYIDPPYGIKFASNFQPEIGKRDVKDKETDLTREPEMVKAYRDTWKLGVHSYLAYLRDRLIVARELLADSGSIFVQIGDENLHSVRQIMDEVFGAENFCSVIAVWKTSSATSLLLPATCDYLLWYARGISAVKYRELYIEKDTDDPSTGSAEYKFLFLPHGERRAAAACSPEEVKSGKLFRPSPTTSQSGTEATRMPVEVEGQAFTPGPGGWKTNVTGFNRLTKAGRLMRRDKSISYVRFLDDFAVIPVTNLWTDVRWGFDASEKRYVVETNPKVVARCMLMTTDPGDLVLDPTCGSGTTAYVAEQWGRRWITTDTSRVAVSIARQRLLTSKYEYFSLKYNAKGVGGGFRYKTVPHITLKTIAQNAALDPIFFKHEPILEAKLAAANAALKRVSEKLGNELRTKLALKQKQEGKKAITDADRRRWELPKQWQQWEVPFDTDSDYPADLKKAVEEYRAAWRAKMDEVNACIAANAEQEELVDQPGVDRKITRVSGPFTVEAVQPPEMSLGDAIEVNAGQFAGEPDELGETFVIREVQMGESAQNVEAYLAKMVDLLKMDGVRFPDNKHMKFTRLDAVYASGNAAGIHAEGRWVTMGESDADPEGDATVGVVFGPQYGPITAKMIEEVIRPASRRYDDLVFAGFSFDGPAQAVIDEGHPKLRMHLAHIRPDVNPGMNGLLKEQPGSQLFTVFGRPRTTLDGPDSDGMYRLKMEGVDIYDPVTNAIVDTGAAKVAAWFVDGDYDGLDRINNCTPNPVKQAGISVCVDLSATPFYLHGSGYPEGRPFPWIVSDFGLVDAIESGIVKIPRLPVLDTTGRPDPKYFKLWKAINEDLQPAERLPGKAERPKPDVVYREAEGALQQIASQWKERYEQIQAAKPGQEQVPPVMIIVCNDTDIAEVFYRKISGEIEEEVVTEAEVAEVLGEDENGNGNGSAAPKKGKGAKKKKRVTYGQGAIFPELFSNTPTQKRTIRIDTKLLAEAESDSPDKKKQDAAEELRRVVATVGKRGELGEYVRCVVSVSMLTEGWDANNVTQVLGVRAFGSQLLCEQVVGRGLRRMDYVPDPATGLLTEEYVDVYGIPFSVIPFKGRATGGPPPDDRPKNHVRALPERKTMEIRFPVVEGYAFALRKNLIRCDVSLIDPLVIEPNREPTATFVRPTVGYQEGTPSAHSAPFQFVQQDRDEYYAHTHLQTIEFEIARLIVDELTVGASTATDVRRRVLRFQSRHQLFPQVFRCVDEYVQRKVNFNGAHPSELGLEKYVKRMVERLRDGIVPDESEGEPPLMPILNRYTSVGTTADVDFKTTRPCHAALKSHIDQVVMDNLTWEASASFRLESSEAVAFYARNDHMGLVIPYEYMDVDHSYEPDFLVRLENGVTLVLEIKGFEDDQDKAKHTAARRWVTAVNNWGELGSWAFHVCRNPQLLDREIRYILRTSE